MAPLKDTFISTAVYNTLPHITEASQAPTDHSADLADLRSLLAKHNVPKGVSVRLIHKHFDVLQGEMMVFKQVTAQPFGRLLVMRPIVPNETSHLRGVNYFVDDSGLLQAYEYTESEVLDMSDYTTFLDEFCALVAERGLQHMFGLKLPSDWKETYWTEFEFPSQRSTMILPRGMPRPEGSVGIRVTTEWGASDPEEEEGIGEPKGHWCASHCNSHCHSHCANHCEDDGIRTFTGGEWYLGAERVEPGTPVHNLVTAVIAVW